MKNNNVRSKNPIILHVKTHSFSLHGALQSTNGLATCDVLTNPVHCQLLYNSITYCLGTTHLTDLLNITYNQ